MTLHAVARLRIARVRPGEVIDIRRAVVHANFGTQMMRCVLQYHNGEKWVDVGVGDDGEP